MRQRIMVILVSLHAGMCAQAQLALGPPQTKDLRWLLTLSPTPLAEKQAVGALAFSPEGRTVTTVDLDQGKVSRWDAGTGKLLHQWVLGKTRLERATLSSDGNTLAVFDKGGVVGVWEARTGRRLHLLQDAVGHNLLLSQDGTSLVAGAKDGSLAVWDMASGKMRTRLDRSTWTWETALVFSPDGKKIAAARPNRTLGVWNAATGKEELSLPARGSDVRLLAFTPNSKNLAMVAADRSVTSWELEQGKVGKRFHLPAGHNVQCGFFTPNGAALLTGGTDGTVRLIEMASTKERHVFPEHLGGIVTASLAADGRQLAIASADQLVLVREYNNHVGPGIFGLSQPTDAAAAWASLAHRDPAHAYRAMGWLSQQPDQALKLLQAHVKPVVLPDRSNLGRLVEELGSGTFKGRQKASQELMILAEAFLQDLEKFLRKDLPLEAHRRLQLLVEEVKDQGMSRDNLRLMRALEVLEQLPQPAAGNLLRDLARGPKLHPVTQEAVEALQRRTLQKK